MSVLQQATGFFSQGEMKMIQHPSVHFVSINITPSGFEFVGTIAEVPEAYKDSTGLFFSVPWSDVLFINKTKERLIHVVVIQTSDKFYTIAPMHPQRKSPFGVSSTKRLSSELFDAINKAKTQAESEKSSITFCINCGEELEQDSEFCGNCGKKILLF